MRRSTVVVPCFNEAHRLDEAAFGTFFQTPGVELLFVDDGSTDGTRERLLQMCARSGGRARVLALSHNQGKGEAVRQGLLASLKSGADIVGYFDADCATPPSEMLRLLALVDEGAAQVALGARVALLGTDIRRRAARHYLGRVFATFASLIVDLPVYDTQCGAKAFRRTELLSLALSEPFAGRWAFDVELLGRLVAGAPGIAGLTPSCLVEMPLRRWTDVPDSKLGWFQASFVAFELLGIKLALMEWRRSPRLPSPMPVAQLDAE